MYKRTRCPKLTEKKVTAEKSKGNHRLEVLNDKFFSQKYNLHSKKPTILKCTKRK